MIPDSARCVFRRCHFAATLALLAATLFSSNAFAAGNNSEAELWSALRDGKAFAIMRHALAPGTGDPDHFDVSDCSTQRNLDDRGRAQARLIGEQFRENGIEFADVLTSQWCRCRETAELLGLGAVAAFEPINSFFRNFEKRDAQTAETRAFLAGKTIERPLVLVTHQVNITALLGPFAASGEVFIVEPSADGTMTILGSIETDP